MRCEVHTPLRLCLTKLSLFENIPFVKGHILKQRLHIIIQSFVHNQVCPPPALSIDSPSAELAELFFVFPKLLAAMRTLIIKKMGNKAGACHHLTHHKQRLIIICHQHNYKSRNQKCIPQFLRFSYFHTAPRGRFILSLYCAAVCIIIYAQIHQQAQRSMPPCLSAFLCYASGIMRYLPMNGIS